MSKQRQYQKKNDVNGEVVGAESSLAQQSKFYIAGYFLPNMERQEVILKTKHQTLLPFVGMIGFI